MNGADVTSERQAVEVAADLARAMLNEPVRTTELAIKHVADQVRSGNVDPVQVAKLQKLLVQYEKQAEMAPVQSVHVIDKYGFKILDDGFVTFTLPAGASYAQLFEDANEYCANVKNGRDRVAMSEDVLTLFAKRAEATDSVTTEESHDIQGLVPESTYKSRSEQGTLLQKNGLTLPTLEDAAAAAVLYYCATGKDLFEGKWVRTAAGLGLKSFSDGLFVHGLVCDAYRHGAVGCAASRNQKS